MKNNYNIEKIIDSLFNRGFTNFLTQTELKLVKGKLRKDEYKIYEIYPDANKVILYKKSIPNISVFKIESKENIRHQDIMGTIFSLGLKEDVFGDIIFYNGNFYIFVLPMVENYIMYNLTEIRNNSVKLTLVDIDSISDFKQEYQINEIIVSSLRIDNVVSTIINSSRKDVIDKFFNDEVILNYEVINKGTRVLREGDVFSIRRYGKYRFDKILKTTKKGGFIIQISKFV